MVPCSVVFAHRLLLLAETFPPSVGGIEAYLSGLWSALPPASSFVVAATRAGDRTFDAQQRYPVTRAAAAGWTYPRWRGFWRAARAVVPRARIEAVVCGKALFEGRVALRLQQEFALPFVVCTYGMEIPVWLKGRKTRADLTQVLRAAARVVVINEPTKRLLGTLGVPDQRLVKIYPGVAENFFQPVDDAVSFRERYGLIGKRVIVSVARLVPRKGQPVLLAAFPLILRAFPRAHLLLVGDGPERRSLEAQVARRGLVSAVTFLGAVPDADVRRAFAVAEVFALTPLDDPTDPEGFGMVYLEAAAGGLPAVGTLAGGVPESVLDGETGLLVPPADATATASALIRLLTNAPLRARLAVAARARANREFHWKGRALLWQGVVASLLGEAGAAVRNRR